MTAKGGIETNIEPGFVARVVAGARYALTGSTDWFGPGSPLPPSAPAEIEGRQFQVPISYNALIQTKQEGLNFRHLRNFAESCDIVRLLIETRKDQVCGLNWVIKPVDQNGKKPGTGGKTTPTDPRIKEITKFLRKPSKEHSWSEWLRMLLEDMFVIDAPTLYVQKTRGGDLYALRPIDGATIKRIIDTHGWTPQPPDPAYQQILQGTAALSYTVDELIYKPRNPRTNKIYGYSPVEQVIVTMQLLLKRQASNLEFYDNGNLPEGFITGGKDWTPQQLKEYQDILDAMLSGNLAERRKVRVVPVDGKYQAVKEPALKSDYDEWLVRIACFAFNYPPTPFIKQMNRATSESSKESADEEGIQPITRWVKEMIDDIIQNRMGYDDLEFGFEDKEAQDPLERAKIDQIYVACEVLDPDEVRSEMGLPPKPKPTPEEIAAQANAAAAVNAPPANAIGPQAEKPVAAPVTKLFKAAGDGTKRSKPPSPERLAAEQQLAEELGAALDLSAEEAASVVGEAIAAGESQQAILATVDQLALKGLAEVSDELTKAITNGTVNGAQTGLLQLGIMANEGITEQVNQSAITWAERRAASLITSDASGGELIDATRTLIRAEIEAAVENGSSTAQLAKALREHYAFSADRAMVIARTELAMAESNGNLQAYLASGVVQKKRWILDPDPCPVCIANAAQGEIALLQEFQGGVMTAPQHPNCRCAIAPVID